MSYTNKINSFYNSGSPSRPNLPNSPAQSSTLRHTPQNSLVDGNSNGSALTHHPMNFDYSHQNGLELAGFCSPSGKTLSITDYLK